MHHLRVGMRLTSKINFSCVNNDMKTVLIEEGHGYIIETATHLGSESIYEIRRVPYLNDDIRISLKDWLMFDIFGLKKASKIATVFKAVTDCRYSHIEQETKTLSQAKSFLKKHCNNGHIEAKIDNCWIRVIELDKARFKRAKTYNGFSELSYVKF